MAEVRPEGARPWTPVVLAAVAVSATGLVLARFAWASSAGAAACAGTWAPFVLAPLLYASGLPILLLGVRVETVRRRVLFGSSALLVGGYVGAWFPWSYTVGVCVEPARVTQVRMLGARSVELGSLRSADRRRTPTSDRFLLGDLVIPLEQRLGRGGAARPEELADALVQAFHRAEVAP